MAKLATIEPGYYRIPLPQVLTDSTHGEMRRLRTANRCGCATPTARRASATPTRSGATAPRSTPSLRGRSRAILRRRRMPTDRGAVAKRLVGAALRRPRRPERAGAVRLRHRAVGPEGEARRACRYGSLLGGFDPDVPCYAGGIDLELSAGCAAAADRRQPGQGFSRHQDEGRARSACAEDVARCAAMREHPRRRLSADGGRQHEMDGRLGDPRRARVRSRYDLVWLEEPIIPDDHGRPRARRARGRPADRSGRELAHAVGVHAIYRERRRSPIPSPTSPIAAASRRS